MLSGFLAPPHPATYASTTSEQCFAFSLLKPTSRGAHITVQLATHSAEPTRDFNPQVSEACRQQHKKSRLYKRTAFDQLD